MVTKPPLPDGYELPASINGWHHDPESNKNGHAWYSADGETAVAVFSGFESVRAVVSDERCDGLGRGQRVYEREYENDTDGRERERLERQAVVDGIDAAREWMHETEPEEWAHPDVCEAVFDAPIGYELEYYFLEDRESTVYYRREDAEKVSRFAGMHEPETYTRETCPYLYVHQWNGSGNATVALAPWLRAHGPKSKHPEIKPVVETPDECGLEVAVTMARQWVRKFVDAEIDTAAAGQADLGRWSA